jgi:alkylresorcinol/alkylpyrone synthase
MIQLPTQTRAPRLEAVATALPPHRYTQAEVQHAATRMLVPGLAAEDHRLLAVFESSGIEHRHFCMPLDWYEEARGFAETNRRYVACGLELAAAATRKVLERAGLTPADVDHIVLVSTTGLATPSLDARLVNVLPFSPHVRRTPVWGLGCAGGAAGLARAADLARGEPGARVLLVALELCSLTFQHGDLDRRNVVAASLFADGAAAALIAGPAARPAPGAPSPAIQIAASHSMLWRDTLDVMGWDVDGDGLHVIFSRDIPSIVRERFQPNLVSFLGGRGLAPAELDHLLAHPGGPRVLAAYAEAMGWPADRFARSREVLRDCGNMSSPTCLFVMERALAAGDLAPGQRAAVAALGPGFASELVLLERSAS